jgi:hypothetical protein
VPSCAVVAYRWASSLRRQAPSPPSVVRVRCAVGVALPGLHHGSLACRQGVGGGVSGVPCSWRSSLSSVRSAHALRDRRQALVRDAWALQPVESGGGGCCWRPSIAVVIAVVRGSRRGVVWRSPSGACAQRQGLWAR